MIYNHYHLKENLFENGLLQFEEYADFMSKIPLDGAPLTSSKEIKLNQ